MRSRTAFQIVVAALGLLASARGLAATAISPQQRAATATTVAAAPALAVVVAQVPLDELAGALTSGDFEGAAARIKAWPGVQRAAGMVLLVRLQAIAAALATAEQHAAAGRFQRATKVVDDLKGTISGDDSLLLKAGIERRLAAIEEKAAAVDQAAAVAILSRAGTLLADEQAAEAEALYDQILARPSPLLSDVTIAEARRGKADAQVLKARQAQPWRKTWASISDGARTIAVWVLFILAAMVVIWLWSRAIHLAGARDTTVIAAEDLTAANGDRRAEGWALSQQLKQLLEASQLSGEQADIDPGEDFDRSGLANVQLESPPVGGLAELTAASDPVRVGPFAATPRQIASLMGSGFRRPSARSVTCVLSGQAGAVQLTLTLDRADGRKSGSFTGASRAEVLDEATDFLTFELASWRLTRSFASYRELRRAQRVMAKPGGGRAGLEQALARLQQSLGHDPRNWTAQFRCAIVLRKLGRNAEAAELLRALERDVKAGGNDGCARFLENNPAFSAVVSYSLAVTLSKIDDWDERREAQERFEKLSADARSLRERGADLAARSWARVEMLAKAGLAAVLTGEMDHMRQRSDTRDREKRMSELGKQVATLKTGLEAGADACARLDPLGQGIAVAVALNAYGRGRYLLGNHEQAEEALIAARTRNPRLACALINLAQVYEKQLKRRPELVEAVEELLADAVKLSPDNRKAHYLLGKLYTFGGRLDFDRARAHFLKAGRQPWIDMVHAQLLATKDVDAAVELLSNSLRRFPKPADYRLQHFISLLLKLPVAELTRDHLDQARQAAAHITEKAGFSARVCETAQTRVRQLESRLPAAPRVSVDDSEEGEGPALPTMIPPTLT